MLLYQKNDLLNFVKGNLPESPALYQLDLSKIML